MVLLFVSRPFVKNVLGGALFSPTYATLLLALLTTIGSLCASMLSKPLAPIMTQFFPRALEVTRHAIEGDNREGGEAAAKSPAWVRLSILRLIGVVPWSGINIACGVCGVAIGDCFLGTFIGSLPWTAVTCQVNIWLYFFLLFFLFFFFLPTFCFLLLTSIFFFNNQFLIINNSFFF